MSPAAKRAPTAGARALNDPKAIVVYVHGIGNKPLESVLKAQWDQALFGIAMGDRTRMAYWVDRKRYPIPENTKAEDSDRVEPDPWEAAASVGTRSVRRGAGEAALLSEIDLRRLDKKDQDRMRRIAARLEGRIEAIADHTGPTEMTRGMVRTKVVPLPRFGRQYIARLVTRHFLKDVFDFLFKKDVRERMKQAVKDRLNGPGPYVVVSHSQGTMIAYAALMELRQAEVPLLVTLGSPLGMQEVQDVLHELLEVKGVLPSPPRVERWVNIADDFDPVAIDPTLEGEYRLVQDVETQNLEGLRDPHSATGYLATDQTRNEVWNRVGTSFAQNVRGFVVARDLNADIADAPDLRHPVLIELKNVRTPIDDAARGAEVADAARAAAGKPAPPREKSADLATAARVLADELAKVVETVAAHEESTSRRRGARKSARVGRAAVLSRADALERVDFEPLHRFASAKLKRSEIELLQTRLGDLNLGRVWRNGVKRALICESSKTVQAETAQLGYGALGKGIRWAILDTGIASHPHFTKYDNIEAQWDCTLPGTLEPPRDPVANGRGRRARGGPDPKRVARDGDGHGTHVAGIIAGCFDPSLRWRDDPDKPAARFTGMAPMTKLHIYKVLDDQGFGYDSYIIKALDHIARLNDGSGTQAIHGINLSLGSSYDPEVFGCGHTPLCEELRRLWRQGVVVVISAGNEGYAVLRSTTGNVEANLDLSIGDPANLDDAIAVGSVHKINPHTYGISYFSSRGPTADGRKKPDVVAPGERILSAIHGLTQADLDEVKAWEAERKGAAAAAGAARRGRTRAAARRGAAERFVEDLYVEMGGTSMAAPHVSGMIAAFLSLRQEFIGYPDRVKQILLANCTDLGRDPYVQGHGLPNLVKMLLNT